MNEWMKGRKKNCSSENKIANKIRRMRKHLSRFYVLNMGYMVCGAKLDTFCTLLKAFPPGKYYVMQCNVVCDPSS